MESLGPMFIKFGQLLSTRTDVVPLEITSYLKGLTDQCQSFPTHKVKQIIELPYELYKKEIKAEYSAFEDYNKKNQNNTTKPQKQ